VNPPSAGRYSPGRGQAARKHERPPYAPASRRCPKPALRQTVLSAVCWPPKDPSAPRGWSLAPADVEARLAQDFDQAGSIWGPAASPLAAAHRRPKALTHRDDMCSGRLCTSAEAGRRSLAPESGARRPPRRRGPLAGRGPAESDADECGSAPRGPSAARSLYTLRQWSEGVPGKLTSASRTTRPRLARLRFIQAVVQAANPRAGGPWPALVAVRLAGFFRRDECTADLTFRAKFYAERRHLEIGNSSRSLMRRGGDRGWPSRLTSLVRVVALPARPGGRSECLVRAIESARPS